jgi:aconitate hydratase
VDVEAVRDGQAPVHFQAQARLDSDIEVAYYRNGGILNYVLRQFLNRN